MADLVMEGIAKAQPKLAMRFSDLNRVIKKALSPEAPYPYTPGNIEPETTPDLIGDIKSLGFKDYHTLVSCLNATTTGTVDDNNLLLENLIQLLSKLPESSKEGKQLTDGLLTQLWSSLEHPPPTSLSPRFCYRSADGAGNNVHSPSLGAAGTAYARTVPPLTFQPPNQPDPATIFDTLMARGETFTPHPQGISSVLFYLAIIITHDIFQTSPEDHSVNLASSYLDLSPLYGRNEEEQRSIRVFKGGLLKPDCFSSKRILGFPPGVGLLLVMFNRFHNYVVVQLARINEANRFPPPPPSLSDPALAAHLASLDESLFQTGHLITCGLYASLILKDYVRTILALNRSPTSWNLDPRSNSSKLPQGRGNQVSVEFNLVYRWHSALSERDGTWVGEELKSVLGGKEPEEVGVGEMVRALAKWEESIPAKPEERRFGGLARQADGTYEDQELVKVWCDSVEDIAGAFGANKVPNALRSIEGLGIMQARHWNVATLNEFRAFLGLTKHTTFEDINPDPVVAVKLKSLYDSPDAVELYPGLMVEKPKPPMDPGSGLCVNYTTSRAILSDAVALIRGDRFHTVDYTPRSVTNWGYNEASSDPAVNQGHVFHKLFFRAFPRSGLPQNSVYAHFPLVVPSENHKVLLRLGAAPKYSWAPPPLHAPPSLTFIRSHAAITSILSNPATFRVVWGEAIMHATSSPFSAAFCLAGDGPANSINRSQMHRSLYSSPTWASEVRSFIRTKTSQLLSKYAIPLAPPPATPCSRETNTHMTTVYEVDLVRDIFALVTTHFMSAMFNLPLKTASNPHGIYSEQELYGVLFALFAAVFFDADVASSLKLREAAKEYTAQLGALILAEVRSPALVGFVKRVGDTIHGHPPAEPDQGEPVLKSFGAAMVARVVHETGGDAEDAVLGSVVMLVASGTANQTQVLAQAMDYYLGKGRGYLDELKRLAGLGGKEADELLMRYMLEGSRLRSTVALYRDVAADQTIADYAPCQWNPAGGLDPIPVSNPEPKTVELKAGTRVVLDITAASHDPAAFPDPEAVRLDRPLGSYMHYGFGPHRCLGMEVSRVVLTEIFKAIVRLPGLTRVDGPRGAMKSFPAARWSGQVGRAGERDWTGLKTYMTPDERSYWPMPTTMRVRYED